MRELKHLDSQQNHQVIELETIYNGYHLEL